MLKPDPEAQHGRMLVSLLFACTPDAIPLARPSPGGADTADEVEPAPVAAWTLLVFLNGDNDLEAWAIEDLEEMEQVGSTDDVNVVIQVDRSTGFFQGEDDWDGGRRWRVEAHPDAGLGSPVLDDLGAVDSGDPDAVVDFAAWALARWPADRVGLVLWDHGDGWSFTGEDAATKSISYDYGSGTDISVAKGEYAELLAGVTALTGRPLDLLGMDACTMMSWEIAWTAAPHAGTYVASQDYEDVSGWAYDTTLADLVADPTMDGPALGERIAARFHEIPDSTLSVLDLGRLAELDAALEELAVAGLASGQAAALLAAAAGAQGFDGETSTNHDVVDLMARMQEATDDADVLAATGAVQVTTGELVLSNYTYGRGVAGALGLSIYSPVDGRVPGLYEQAAWSEATSWDEFLEAAQAQSATAPASP